MIVPKTDGDVPTPASRDEGRRLRSTTGITALAATAAAALFGVLFAQPDDEQAAASPPVAPLPQLAPPPQAEPSPTAADPAAADATVAATPAPAPGRQHVHRSAPAPPRSPRPIVRPRQGLVGGLVTVSTPDRLARALIGGLSGVAAAARRPSTGRGPQRTPPGRPGRRCGRTDRPTAARLRDHRGRTRPAPSGAETAGQCGPCMSGLPASPPTWPRWPTAASVERAWPIAQRLAEIPGRGACGHPDGAVRHARSALQVFADDATRHATGAPCAWVGLPTWIPGGL